MKRHSLMLCIRVALVGLLVSAPSLCEETDRSPKNVAAAEVPTFAIRFVEDTNASIPYPDGLSAVGVGCGGKGEAYVQVYGNGMGLLGLTAKGIVSFSTDKMTDIPEPSASRSFVSKSGVYLLVTGTENARKERLVAKDTEGKEVEFWRTTGKQRHYLARFDLDGKYKGALKLDLPFEPIQFGAFASGSLIVAGVDEHKRPRVALLDSGGGLLRYLELPKDISDPAAFNDDEVKLAGENAPKDLASLFAVFYPYRESLLLVRSFTGTPIYELHEDGRTRPLKINMPADQAVSAMVSSDTNWLIDFGRPVAPGQFYNADHFLYEVNAESGKLVRQYLLPGGESVDSLKLSVACFFGGEFTAVRHRDGKITLLRGTPEPAVAVPQPAMK